MAVNRLGTDGEFVHNFARALALGGEPYYRLRIAEAQVTLVVTLLAHGCPVAAIVAAFQLDERTVYAWHSMSDNTVNGCMNSWCNSPAIWGMSRGMKSA